MKKSEITKREALASDLKSLAPRFPHQEQMMWAIKNNMSLYTVLRYLKGEIGSSIIAEKLRADIKDYLKGEKIGTADKAA